jgi:outer membrane protein assembly factor BamB
MNTMRFGGAVGGACRVGLLVLLAIALLPCALRAGEADKPQAPLDKSAVAEKVKQLGDNAWKTREEAQRDLVAAGESALEEVEKALQNDDPEIKQRCQSILEAIRKNLREGASQTAGKGRLWTSPVKEGVASPAAKGGGVLCFLSFDGFLRAVDANTGKALWTFEDLVKESDAKNLQRMVAGLPTFPAPVIADGLVFASAQFGRAYAIDLAHGEIKWKSASADGFAPPAVGGGKAFLAGTEKDLRCLDVATGKWTWRADLEGGCTARPAVVGEAVYVAGREGSLYSYAVKDGARKVAAADLAGMTDLLALANGELVVRTVDALICIDPDGNKQKWNCPLPQDPMRAQFAMAFGAGGRRGGKMPAPPQAEDGIVAAGDALYTTAAGQVHAVEASTGKLLWTFKPESKDDENAGANGMMNIRQGAIVLGGQGRFFVRNTGTGMLSNPCVVGQTMYVASPDGLHAVELKARQELWRLATKGVIAARPMAIDGVLYYGTSDLAALGGGGAAGVVMVAGPNGVAVQQPAQPKAEQPADSEYGLNALRLKAPAAAK